MLADRGGSEIYLLGSMLVCLAAVQGISIVIINPMVPTKKADQHNKMSKVTYVSLTLISLCFLTLQRP